MHIVKKNLNIWNLDIKIHQKSSNENISKIIHVSYSCTRHVLTLRPYQWLQFKSIQSTVLTAEICEAVAIKPYIPLGRSTYNLVGVQTTW